MAKLTEIRAKVLAHIELHSARGRFPCRVPDAWIEEANASIADGQSTHMEAKGRVLTDAGRAALAAQEK